MCPVTVQCLAPTVATTKALKIFPFFNNDATIHALLKGLPQYVVAVTRRNNSNGNEEG